MKGASQHLWLIGAIALGFATSVGAQEDWPGPDAKGSKLRAETEEDRWRVDAFGTLASARAYPLGEREREIAQQMSTPGLAAGVGLRLRLSSALPTNLTETKFMYRIDGLLLLRQGRALGSPVCSAEPSNESITQAGSQNDCSEPSKEKKNDDPVADWAAGEDFFAGMQWQPTLPTAAQEPTGLAQAFVGRRGTLRSVDALALGGRDFRFGAHIALDLGFVRLMASPLFRPIANRVAPANDRLAEDPRQTFVPRPPVGQFAAVVAGTTALSAGLFGEIYQSTAGHSTTYTGIGVASHVGNSRTFFLSSLSFEQSAGRSRSRYSPDGTARLYGAAGKLSLGAGWHGWRLALNGFVAEPALRRKGSHQDELERSGYVAPYADKSLIGPIFSDLLGGTPAPLLCDACSSGYVVSYDRRGFHAPAATGSVSIGYDWESGRVLATGTMIAPLQPRTKTGDSPFDGLRPTEGRLVEMGVTFTKKLSDKGELQVGLSRLVERNDGSTRLLAESVRVAFRQEVGGPGQ